MLPNHLDKLSEEIKNIFQKVTRNNLENYEIVSTGVGFQSVTFEIDYKENISEVHEPIEISIKINK